jgi:hypothetical protein
MGAAIIGFFLGYIVILFWAGLPQVRRFFLKHGGIVNRVVGVTFTYRVVGQDAEHARLHSGVPGLARANERLLVERAGGGVVARVRVRERQVAPREQRAVLVTELLEHADARREERLSLVLVDDVAEHEARVGGSPGVVERRVERESLLRPCAARRRFAEVHRHDRRSEQRSRPRG